jgi:hypothetical protein
MSLAWYVSAPLTHFKPMSLYANERNVLLAERCPATKAAWAGGPCSIEAWLIVWGGRSADKLKSGLNTNIPLIAMAIVVIREARVKSPQDCSAISPFGMQPNFKNRAD